jgi:hypothetical protein
MKTFYKKPLVYLAISLLVLAATPAFADDPPDPPSTHGENGNQPAGGGTPVGGGLALLIGLGAAYGFRRFRQAQKEGD